MCRLRVEILILATVVAGRGLAQVPDNVSNVSDWTKAMLAAECSQTVPGPALPAVPAGVELCLTALNYYTAPTWAAGASAAIDLLVSGVSSLPISTIIAVSPPVSATTVQLLYRRANDAGKMAGLLATATRLDVEVYGEKQTKALFDDVNKSIRATYRNNVGGLDDGVNKLSAKDPARALYNLLRDLWSSVPPETPDNAVKTMEKYRTCYLLDKARLFGLVRAFLQ
jgi:hypothetical protein